MNHVALSSVAACVVCCSVLYLVAVRVAVCCSVLQYVDCGTCVNESCRILKCCSVSSVLQCVAVCCSEVCCSVLQCDAVCCSVLQCVAVCCSVWIVVQCVNELCHTLERCSRL